MSFKVSDAEGIHALYQNREELRESGWAVLNRDNGSCLVSVNTGTIGATEDTLTVNSGTVLVDGVATDIPQESVAVPAPDSNPRKDIVVIDHTGDVDLLSGIEESISPSTTSLATSERPAPPDLSSIDAVPLAMVMVPVESDSLTTDDVVDLRAGGDISAGKIEASEASLVDRLGIPTYLNDPDAPEDTFYFYPPENALKYKDEDGTVYEAGTGDGGSGGATSLSELDINTSKDWQMYDINNVDEIEATISLHRTDFDWDIEVPEGYGAVVSGPLTGDGSFTGNGNVTDVNDIQELEVHGDEWHSEDYATQSDLEQAGGMQEHGNEWHAVSFVTQTDLDDVEEMQEHGNDWHSEDFATQSDVDNVTEMQNHGNEWHQIAFAGQSDVDNLESELDNHSNNSSAHHSRYADFEAREAVVGSTLSGDVNVDGNVTVGNFLEFEPLSSTPSNPPDYGIWFVDDSS